MKTDVKEFAKELKAKSENKLAIHVGLGLSLGAEEYPLVSELCDLALSALSQPKDAKCPECNDAYSEVCPVCQLDGHPVVEKLRAELNALKQPKDVKRPDEAKRPITSLAYSSQLSSDQYRALKVMVREMDAYADAMEAYATALEQPTAQGWRPIEEAPKDDDFILCVWNGVRYHIGQAHTWKNGFGELEYIWADGEEVTSKIIGFQPLPQPPRSEVSNG